MSNDSASSRLPSRSTRVARISVAPPRWSYQATRKSVPFDATLGVPRRCGAVSIVGVATGVSGPTWTAKAENAAKEHSARTAMGRCTEVLYQISRKHACYGTMFSVRVWRWEPAQGSYQST